MVSKSIAMTESTYISMQALSLLALDLISGCQLVDWHGMECQQYPCLTSRPYFCGIVIDAKQLCFILFVCFNRAAWSSPTDYFCHEL